MNFNFVKIINPYLLFSVSSFSRKDQRRATLRNLLISSIDARVGGEKRGMRTAGKVLEARTSGKGLKEGRVTLRYLAVLPSRRG